MFKAVESVLAGQPDKVCDQIADAIVDEYLRRDPHSRIDVKVFGSHGMLMVSGEVNSQADFDVAALAKTVYHDIGYVDDIEVFVNIEPSSEEMRGSESGATDTAVVNGYATRETREFLPLPVVYAHSVARRLDDLRRLDPAFHWLGPDGKVQIVMEGKEMRAVTLLAQHAKDILPRDAQSRLLERVLEPIVGQAGAQIFINPIGAFVTGGFHADSGMSGRKPGVDFYGGLIPHGDVSLPGKDPLKAERAGAYMARFAAKNMVAQGMADAALVSLAYTLGRSEPVMLDVKATGSSQSSEALRKHVREMYDFRPEAVAERFDLKKPRYRGIAVYGQIGREGLPWEEILKT
ncbi:methionine adenosyltransferase domain-containing protein [Candidatus Uhrbacteria bacterium]|nr:methionine adenosyltransferase domain-containing protein [Candidatus Uhrbacteria bacterium]